MGGAGAGVGVCDEFIVFSAGVDCAAPTPRFMNAGLTVGGFLAGWGGAAAAVDLVGAIDDGVAGSDDSVDGPDDELPDDADDADDAADDAGDADAGDAADDGAGFGGAVDGLRSMGDACSTGCGDVGEVDNAGDGDDGGTVIVDDDGGDTETTGAASDDKVVPNVGWFACATLLIATADDGLCVAHATPVDDGDNVDDELDGVVAVVVDDPLDAAFDLLEL